MPSSNIDTLSHFERVAVALVCFETFCARFEIQHPEIERFTEHLWGITKVEPATWVQWADEFDEMPFLSGELKGLAVLGESIPPGLGHDFAILAKAVFETTAATWYCSNEAGCIDALQMAIGMLKKHGVSHAQLTQFAFPARSRASGSWGPAPTDQAVAYWRSLARPNTAVRCLS